MQHTFSDIFDISRLKGMCEAFTEFSGIALAVVDITGNVHVATGWQDICLKFHRKHPETSKLCHESDTVMANHTTPDKKYKLYTCKNGLIEVAFPIVVNGTHVGNFFTGQFFMQTPDKAFFNLQAEKYNFDKVIYMTDLNKVPVYDKPRLEQVINYLSHLTETISAIGFERIKTLQAKQEHIQKLEDAVQQRTLQLHHANKALCEANKKLQALSLVDQLTSLGNRRALADFAFKEWKRVKRNGSQLAVFMIDVDYFKSFNDCYGHQAGDECLTQIAEVIKQCVCRDTDFIGRYGGEEFICILTNTPCHGLEKVAKSIQLNIKNLNIPHKGSPIASCVTVSIGISVYDKDSTCCDISELIHQADKRLYQAKKVGRDRVIS
jgi:diguanylate cyclase (GGDEF)-like protein